MDGIVLDGLPGKVLLESVHNLDFIEHNKHTGSGTTLHISNNICTVMSTT
jgi:hypothetical protein